MSKQYEVYNKYGISGGSTHRTAQAALIAAQKMTGEGWAVRDSDGNIWVFYLELKAKMVEI